MSLSHCGPQGLLSSDGLQGATGGDAYLSLSSRYPSSCPLFPSSHPRAFPLSNNGRHRQAPHPRCGPVVTWVTAWAVPFPCLFCVSEAPYLLSQGTANLVFASPHHTRSARGVWAKPGAARDAHTPWPALWYPAVSQQAYKSTNAVGLEPGLRLGAGELSSQGFQLTRAKLCPLAILSLTPKVDNDSGVQHRAPDPISTRLL